MEANHGTEQQEERNRLQRENKRLTRELERQQNINRRNQAIAEARANLSQVVSNEKSRLEQYMNLLLANCPDIILFFDSEEKIVYASDSYLKRSHTAAASLIRGKTCRELLAPVVDDAFLQKLDHAFRRMQEENARCELEYSIDFGQDGFIRHYVIQLTPMMDDHGAAAGAMAIFYDSTEITKARDEAERARELAEQSTRAKSDFLSRMSHEMRTPLNAIIGMTNIAQRAAEAERVEYALVKINDASRHLLGVINDVLDISKIEADKFELFHAEFNFEKMLQRVVNVNQHLVDEKQQQFHVSIDPCIPEMVMGDDQRLTQVITNLLSNAIKFTDEKGHVSLSARLEHAEGELYTIRVDITDTGIGISAEQQTRLFTNFEQADGSISRKYGGTGLGLAISKRIIEMMGGRIWLESEIGKGATFSFCVTLPGVGEGVGVGRADEFAQEEGDDAFAGCHVLLVEDLEINREIALAMLEDTGLVIDCVENGKQAVERVASNPGLYDLIFMDIQMPEMDGYEATRSIRRLGTHWAMHIPIIAMTANVFKEDIDKCLEAGMNGHVGKPMDTGEVHAQLRKHLRGNREKE